MYGFLLLALIVLYLRQFAVWFCRSVTLHQSRDEPVCPGSTFSCVLILSEYIGQTSNELRSFRFSDGGTRIAHHTL